jgi:hypothetical protein
MIANQLNDSCDECHVNSQANAQGSTNDSIFENLFLKNLSLFINYSDLKAHGLGNANGLPNQTEFNYFYWLFLSNLTRIQLENWNNSHDSNSGFSLNESNISENCCDEDHDSVHMEGYQSYGQKCFTYQISRCAPLNRVKSTVRRAKKPPKKINFASIASLVG